MGTRVGHLAGQQVLDEAQGQLRGQGVVLLDGGAAGQLSVEVATEGVEVHTAFPLESFQQILQQGLGVAVHQEIGQPAHHQGVGAERFCLHARGF